MEGLTVSDGGVKNIAPSDEEKSGRTNLKVVRVHEPDEQDNNNCELRLPPGYFVPVPYEMAFDPSVSDAALRHYLTIAAHWVGAACAAVQCTACHKRKGRLEGKTERTAIRRETELVQTGWVKRTRRRRGTNVLVPGDKLLATKLYNSKTDGFQSPISGVSPPSRTDKSVTSRIDKSVTSGNDKSVIPNQILMNQNQRVNIIARTRGCEAPLVQSCDSRMDESYENAGLTLLAQKDTIRQNFAPYRQLVENQLNDYDPAFKGWFSARKPIVETELEKAVDRLITFGKIDQVVDLPAYFRNWLREYIERRWYEYLKRSDEKE